MVSILGASAEEEEEDRQLVDLAQQPKLQDQQEVHTGIEGAIGQPHDKVHKVSGDIGEQ